MAKKQSAAGVTVHVDEIASKIAKFYEQIRNVVDYREEHLLRKNSIFRALERRVLLEGRKDDFAESLVKEIIRSGHLPNDVIPEEKIGDIRRIVGNLTLMLDRLKPSSRAERLLLSQWLLRLAASSIEESLDPPLKDRAAAGAMLLALKDNLVVNGKEVSGDDKVIQLFIGIQRALLRVDDDQLSARLLKFLYPQWDEMAPGDLAAVAPELPAIKKTLDAHIANPLGNEFYKLCNRYNTIFLLLGDAVFNEQNFLRDPGELFKDGEMLAMAVREAYRKRHEQQKRRLKRLAFFTIISLFITKVVVAIAVEIPVDAYLVRHYSFWNTAINVAFPPLLMLVIIALIRLPSKNNISLVLAEVRAAAFEEYRKEYLMVIAKERNAVVRRGVLAVYAAVSVAVLYGVVRLLWSIGFSAASIAVFVLFTSIVAATGVRVRNRSKEISLEEDKPTFRGFLADLVFMPFVTIGQLVIRGLSRFRFAVILVNLIDAPFQVFVSFIENLNAFIRSKKEELH